jgi:hypothetical protein
MSLQITSRVTVVGIDIGKNSFHTVGQDHRGRLSCGRSGRVARSRPGLPYCRLSRSFAKDVRVLLCLLCDRGRSRSKRSLNISSMDYAWLGC